jgi:hypothetical protein
MTNGYSSTSTWDAEAYADGILVGVVFTLGVAVGATLSHLFKRF